MLPYCSIGGWGLGKKQESKTPTMQYTVQWGNSQIRTFGRRKFVYDKHPGGANKPLIPSSIAMDEWLFAEKLQGAAVGVKIQVWINVCND